MRNNQSPIRHHRGPQSTTIKRVCCWCLLALVTVLVLLFAVSSMSSFGVRYGFETVMTNGAGGSDAPSSDGKRAIENVPQQRPQQGRRTRLTPMPTPPPETPTPTQTQQQQEKKTGNEQKEVMPTSFAPPPPPSTTTAPGTQAPQHQQESEAPKPPRFRRRSHVFCTDIAYPPSSDQKELADFVLRRPRYGKLNVINVTTTLVHYCLVSNVCHHPRRGLTLFDPIIETPAFQDLVFPSSTSAPSSPNKTAIGEDIMMDFNRRELDPSIRFHRMYFPFSLFFPDRFTVNVDMRMAQQRQRVVKNSSTQQEKRSGDRGNDSSDEEEEIPEDATMSKGLTVMVPQSYCCAHVTHFLEPVGILHGALKHLGHFADKWRAKHCNKERAGAAEDNDGTAKKCLFEIDHSDAAATSSSSASTSFPKVVNIMVVSSTAGSKMRPSAGRFSQRNAGLAKGKGGKLSEQRSKPDPRERVVEIGSFNLNMLSVAVGQRAQLLDLNPPRPSSSSAAPRFIDSKGEEYMCHEQLLVPGSIYNVVGGLPDSRALTDDAIAFVKRQLQEEREKKKKAEREKEQPATVDDTIDRTINSTHAKQEKEVKEEPVSATTTTTAAATSSPRPINIILSRRSGMKRTIVDWDYYSHTVVPLAINKSFNKSSYSSSLPACDRTKHNISAHTLIFGHMNFRQAVQAAANARVFIGMHGADLTNVFFMPKNSAVIEMNPLFFFENRFQELSENLGHKYTAWTCASHKCAFGGEQSRFDAMIAPIVGPFGYNKANETWILMDAKTGKPTSEWFKYKSVGYNAPGCALCHKLQHLHPIQSRFYSTFRESSVLIGAAFREEISDMIADAIRHVCNNNAQ